MSIKVKSNVIIKTANYTILASDSNSLFSNEGAGGAISLSLPTPEVGLTYGFYVDSVQFLTIDAPGVGVRMATLPITGISGVKSNDVGSFLKLTCFKVSEWSAEMITGTWTNA